MHVAWINDQQNRNKLTMQTDHDYRVVPELRDTFADNFFFEKWFSSQTTWTFPTKNMWRSSSLHFPILHAGFFKPSCNGRGEEGFSKIIFRQKMCHLTREPLYQRSC